MVVYFAGMLALATVLTARSWFFVAFAVTGLVQAFFLLEAVSGWIFIICLQTVLTGFFSQRSLRITAMSAVIASWIPWSW
jgi:hypothetical protein